MKRGPIAVYIEARQAVETTHAEAMNIVTGSLRGVLEELNGGVAPTTASLRGAITDAAAKAATYDGAEGWGVIWGVEKGELEFYPARDISTRGIVAYEVGPRGGRRRHTVTRLSGDKGEIERALAALAAYLNDTARERVERGGDGTERVIEPTTGEN